MCRVWTKALSNAIFKLRKRVQMAVQKAFNKDIGTPCILELFFTHGLKARTSERMSSGIGIIKQKGIRSMASNGDGFCIKGKSKLPEFHLNGMLGCTTHQKSL